MYDTAAEKSNSKQCYSSHYMGQRSSSSSSRGEHLSGVRDSPSEHRPLKSAKIGLGSVSNNYCNSINQQSNTEYIFDILHFPEKTA